MPFKEILSNKNIQIYHGSDTIVENPVKKEPVRALDLIMKKL